MRAPRTRVDALVARILPSAPLPSHLRPSQLLDEHVVPPLRVADKVFALRELLRTGGREEPLLDGVAITGSTEIVEHFLPLIGHAPMESLWMVGLDARNHVRFTTCVARGGIVYCAVHVADLLRPLVLNAAPGGIAVHNHPSGSPTPSKQDLELTEALVRGADLLGLRIVDHIIVAADGHFSFADSGLLHQR